MGAHALAPPVRPPFEASFLFLFLISSSWAGANGSKDVTAAAAAAEEVNALQIFKSSLNRSEALPSWDARIHPCSGNTSSWNGVLCNQGRVWGLQLENMQLGGTINLDALSRLPELRTLSLMNNLFEGPMPHFKSLPKLRSIYISRNHFWGGIPDDAFLGMDALRRVYLSSNSFTGKVPTSLAHLPILVEARLEGNQFDGTLPSFQQKELPFMNVSNNHLEGPIPPRFHNLPASSFSGNRGLCGPPLDPCNGGIGSSLWPSDKKKKSRAAIIVILLLIALVLIIVAMMVGVLVWWRRRRNNKLGRTMSSNRQYKLASYDGNQDTHAYVEKGAAAAAAVAASTRDNEVDGCIQGAVEQGKLEFVRNDRRRFDMGDLLTASAEVLDSGTFMSSYKVEIFEGQAALVVKRFRQMSKVGRRHFRDHVRHLGNLNHPNVLPLVAFFYRREEKLLIFDFVDNGSLATHLHGNRTPEESGLDWPTRLKIIKGVARGLAYLYEELPGVTVPHGHLKSSNVLLDKSFEPLLIDYALLPLINPDHGRQLMVAYRSPDYAQLGRVSHKTDVWSLGILILEVLTGKFPTNFLAIGNVKGENLASWVNAIAAQEERGGVSNVFDKDMGDTFNAEAEMTKLLRIGLSCCQQDVDVRWSIHEALFKIEEVQETHLMLPFMTSPLSH